MTPSCDGAPPTIGDVEVDLARRGLLGEDVTQDGDGGDVVRAEDAFSFTGEETHSCLHLNIGQVRVCACVCVFHIAGVMPALMRSLAPSGGNGRYTPSTTSPPGLLGALCRSRAATLRACVCVCVCVCVPVGGLQLGAQEGVGEVQGDGVTGGGLLRDLGQTETHPGVDLSQTELTRQTQTAHRTGGERGREGGGEGERWWCRVK